jgi:hypothetical protein
MVKTLEIIHKSNMGNPQPSSKFIYTQMNMNAVQRLNGGWDLHCRSLRYSLVPRESEFS